MTTFNLYWSLTSPVTLASNKISGVVSPYDHIGLLSNTRYYYALTAVYSGPVESGLSNELSALTFSDPPNFNPVGYAGYNKLTWPVVAGGISYNIYWSTTPSVTKSSNKISGIMGLSYNHAANTLIYYAMSTVNAAGESDLSPIKIPNQIGYVNTPFMSNGNKNRTGLARKRNLTDMGSLVVLLKLNEMIRGMENKESVQLTKTPMSSSETITQSKTNGKKTVVANENKSNAQDAALGIGGALALAVVVGSQLGEIEEK